MVPYPWRILKRIWSNCPKVWIAEISRLAEQVRAGREVLAGRLGGAQQGEERERAQEPSRRFAGWSVDPTASH